MNNFFRNNSKKLLAIFGVLLMVVFVLPSSFKGGNNTSAARLIGHIGKQKVFQSDIDLARRQWEMLGRMIVFASPESAGEYRPIAGFLLQQGPQGPRAAWFAQLNAQIERHPEVYFLLQKEADRLGIVLSVAQIDSAFEAQHLAVQMNDGSGRDLPIGDVATLDPELANAARSAYSAMLRVYLLINRAEQTLKVSAPRRELQLAQGGQEMKVNTVEFSAEEFLPKVGTPTADDLKKQFDTYADMLAGPGNTGAADPLGFGYKFPDRVTLQYIGVIAEDVRKAVRASKDDYQWKVDAYKEYKTHSQYYLSTPSSSQPTTKSTGSTTRPFEEVKDEIIERLVTPDASRKLLDAQDRINQRLAADWTAFDKNHPTTRAATAPSTQPDEKFATYQYLTDLAQDIKKQTGVLPVVGQVGKFSSAKELSDEPNIGHTMFGQNLYFGAYATTTSTAILPAESANSSFALSLFQPSQLVKDPGNGSTFTFRLTGVKPAARPMGVDEVVDAVTKDWKTIQAYEMAKAEAGKLVALANGDDKKAATTMASTTSSTQSAETGIGLAATTMGRKVVMTGPFNLNARADLSPLVLDQIDSANFQIEASKLLQIGTTRPANTVSVIELPSSKKVFAVDIASLVPLFPPADKDRASIIAGDQMIQGEGQRLELEWLDFDGVAKRVDWKDERKDKSASSD